MKKLLLFGTFFVLSLLVKAQNYAWAHGIGGLGDDYAESITTDASGNVYVTGSFSLTADFDPSANTAILTSGGADIFIAKYDHNGNYLWAKSMSSSSLTLNSIGRCIKTDANGNVYITGYFSTTTDFDPSTNTAILTPQQPGNSAIFVAKYDNNGNYLWAKAIDGGRAEGRSLTIDASGNVLVTGGFIGTLDFDPSANTANLTAKMYYSAFIAKYDANGNYLWVKGIGSTIPNYDAGMTITTDINNNVYIAGYFAGNAVDITTNTAILSSAGGTDIFMAKYDGNGNYLWAKSMGSAQNYEYGVSITADVNSNVYVTGRFSGVADFDPGTNVANLAAAGGIYGGTDIFIAKYTTNGSYLWAHAFGIAGSNDTGYSVLTDMNGDYVYVVGNITGTADFDPSPNTANLTSNGGNFLAKYDASGNYVWAKNIGDGTVGDDTGSLIALDGLGNLYMVSCFQGTVDVDPGITTATLTSAGNKDICIVKYSTCYTVNNPQQVCGSYSIGNHTYSATGTYTTILQSVLGCDSVVITQLIIDPTPTLTVNSGAICSGQTFTLNPTGAQTYTYSSVSSTVSPVTSTTYTITGSGPNGCTGTAVSTVIVHPIPTLTVNSGSVCPGMPFTMNPSGAMTYTYSSGSNTVSPLINSTYTIGGTDGNGCQGTVISTVTINTTVPAIFVNSGTICSHQTFTIIPSGASTYTYSSVSNTVSPVVNSTYTVTGTDLNGCVNSVGAISTVSVNAVPSLTTTQNISLCIGTSTLLNVAGANAYVWSTTETTSSITVTPTLSTTYTVTGTDINNCSSTQTVSVNINQTCQDVWPGDANSDGTANNLDILELGLHYTQTGPARATTSNNWQSYFSNNWTGTLSNGKNVNHSDCNGDGIIDANDTLAIYNNYGLTHAFKPTQQTVVNPELSIVPDQTFVNKGDWGTASVFLGEASNPLTNVNGIAFTIDFDHTLLESNSVWMEYPLSFIDNGQNLHFRKLDFQNGKLYAATTHTTSTNVTGNGKIATLHYRIKSTLATDATLGFGISQAYKSNAGGVINSITAGTASVTAVGASVGVNELAGGSYTSVYPNPAVNEVMVSSGSLMDKIEITSVTGQSLLKVDINAKNYSINTSELSNGIYFIRIFSNGVQTAYKKLVIQK